MNKIRLGSSGVEVSALCLGTDALGSRRDLETSFALLDTFREGGGTFVDTGNFYAAWLEGCVGGESETAIGKWLKERGCRDQMAIATKLGFDYPGCEGGLSAAEIERECEKSLRRLGTDRLDLYYAHRDDPATPVEETMGAFDRLVKSGKVRAIGASNLPVWRIAEANTTSGMNGYVQYSVVQQRHTYLRPRHAADFGPQIPINADLKGYCQARGIAMVAYSVLIQGCYGPAEKPVPAQYAGPESDERLAVLEAVAQETGATKSQVVLAWMLASEPRILPIIAGSTPAQIRENIAALDVALTPEQVTRLDTAGNPEIKQAWLR